MINLIPTVAKKRISFEYWTRVISVCLLILTGVIVTGTLLLLPVYVRINSQIMVYADSAETATEKVSKYDISSSALIKTSQQARQLLDLRGNQNFTDVATILTALTNNEVTIDSFEFRRGEKGLSPINISGKAATRQSLADFRKRLIEHESIASAFLPISNLTQDKDITFNVTVTMK